MQLPKLKPYLKKLDYSYSFGVFPTLELMKHRPQDLLKVLFSSDAENNAGATEIYTLCEQQGVAYEINDRAIQKLAYKENTQVIAIFQKSKYPIAIDKSHIVLSNPKNMGNLGTIVRAMVGFGYHDLILIGQSADIFDPKVVRASMGAFFHINFAKYATFEEYRNEFSKSHYTYAFALSENAMQLTELTDQRRNETYSLVFGNEGEGLRPDEILLCDKVIKIPQSSSIESYNLAISSAVAMWEFSKNTYPVYN